MYEIITRTLIDTHRICRLLNESGNYKIIVIEFNFVFSIQWQNKRKSSHSKKLFRKMNEFLYNLNLQTVLSERLRINIQNNSNP